MLKQHDAQLRVCHKRTILQTVPSNNESLLGHTCAYVVAKFGGEVTSEASCRDHFHQDLHSDVLDTLELYTMYLLY